MGRWLEVDALPMVRVDYNNLPGGFLITGDGDWLADGQRVWTTDGEGLRCQGNLRGPRLNGIWDVELDQSTWRPS